jgi:hypothetical protein
MPPKAPVEASVSGPAYSRSVRLIATLATFGLLAYGAGLVLAMPTAPSREGWILVGAVAFTLIGTWYFMVTSRTTIDEHGIRQTGLMERKAQWSEIRQARVRGFAFSRRLVVYRLGARFQVYNAGTPELAGAFEKVASAFARR